MSSAVWAQDVMDVSGTVSDSFGDSLPGVSIVVDGTSTGTITNIDGIFNLKVPLESILEFSFIGMKTQTQVSSKEMTVVLLDETTDLDAVIVTGYTSEKKKDLTGSVAVIDMDMVQKGSAPNVLQSLQGTASGVNIITDAAPGGGNTQIRIRGMSTLNSNQPLYVIDGVPTTENINSLNPNDIESMQILKDAASASIYGARAANGVIVITTKKAKKGKVSVEFDASTTIQTIAKNFDVLNSDQWGQAYFTAQRNDGIATGHPFYGYGDTPQSVDYLDADKTVPYSNTDWQDEIYSTAILQKYGVTVSNGGEKGSVLFSTSYVDQDGIIDETFYQRFSTRINSTFNVSDKVRIGENLMIAKWNERGAATQNDRGVTYNAFRQHPALPVKDNNGIYTNPLSVVGSDIANPAHEIQNNKDDENQSWRILGNAYLEIEPIKDLTFKSNIGIEHLQYLNRNLTRPLQPSDVSSVSREYGQGDTWTWTNTAFYKKQLGNHRFDVLAGTEAIEYRFENVGGFGRGYTFYDDNFMIIDAATGERSSNGGVQEWAMFSIFGKVNYNFKDKYLLSATIRKDATSRLASGYNSDIFPAFTGAWRLSEENFMPVIDWLSDVKLRGSWGKNGNSNISNYAIYNTYVNDPTNGISIATTGSPDLVWETTTQTNIGADLALFNNQFSVNLDYYTKFTTDMLTIPPVLSAAGQNAARWTNTGDMENTGFELSLGYNSKVVNDFSWSSNFNLGMYKNKLVKINNLVSFTGTDIRNIEGQPLGVFYGFVTDGIFQDEESVRNHADQTGKGVGRLRYVDLNNDGVINDDDRSVIGDPNPDLTMGLNLDATFKNFTLSAFLSSELGFDIYNQTRRQLDFMTYGPSATNRGVSTLDAWSTENRGANVPLLTLLDTNNETRASSYFIEDGSYVRLKFLRLNYQFGQSVVERLGLGSLSIYGQAENLFTITNYSGLDPESAIRGVDNAPYPMSRNFILGLNVKF